MISSTARRSAYIALLAASTCYGSLALAQTVPPDVDLPPIRSSVDENDVNLVTGKLLVTGNTLTIGSPKSGGLSFERFWTGNGWRHNYVMTINPGSSSNSVVVNLGRESKTFSLSGGVYTDTEGTGATLTDASGDFTYTSSDGMIVKFTKIHTGSNYYSPHLGVGYLITNPNGKRVVLSYTQQSFPIPPSGSIKAIRLTSITSNDGYQLKLGYSSPSIGASITQVIAINSTVDYCDPYAATCTGLTQAWPTLSYTSDTETDALNRATRYTSNSSKQIAAIKRPSSSSADTTTIGYDASGRVASVSNGSASWNYSWSVSGTTLTGTRTDPLSHQRITTADTTKSVLLTDKDGLNRVTSYAYDASGRVAEVTQPEGNKVQYAYDTRGNVTITTRVAKAGSGLANIVTTAGYDATCTNLVTCNQPNWTKDALNNQTDYTYDPTHGGVLTATLPAPTAGAARPQTRYSYTALQASYKNAAGTVVASGLPIYRLTGVSSCQSGTSCTGTADEAKTVINYGATDNLLPTSSTTGSGNGALTATVAAGYDYVGNVISSDGPLAGTGDTVRYRYDAGRQLISTATPDPDGGGARTPYGVRYGYNLDGQVTTIDTGALASTDAAAWTSFSPSETVTASYDLVGRRVKEALSSGATTYAVTQYSYDAADRLDCTAVRMNTATFASLPASACTAATTGTAGPDRITKNSYDNADQITKVTTAYGVSGQQRDVVTTTYTSNGKQATVADGRSNLTTYEYDGFDRLAKTRYPLPATPNASSTTDYEQLSYTPNGNVVQRRLRDGLLIGYSYDALDRMTAKTPPSGAFWDLSIAYGYDNLGRIRTVTNSAGDVVTLSHDALGRLTAETRSWGSGTSTLRYDAAGRVTRLTYADGFYVDYDRLVTGEVTAIRENGAASGAGVLATYAYDNLGRRTGVTRGNGTTTSYGYDAVSRLASLGHDVAGTANDVTTTFAYSPASQIASLTRNNDGYAWGGHYNVNRPYGVNGLNQLTTAGSTALGYDGRGNLTSSGANSYAYTSENRLASTGGGARLRSDPLGRLFHVEAGASSVFFDYIGDGLISERAPGAAVLRRYVRNPDAADEVVVWYEGAGTTDRRWLHTDERGSVIAVSNASGAVSSINRYDEYGIPAATNAGRFGYTGQAWLPEIGLWYYKARIYSPTLGRFLQTDPIGYGDGPNWYNYVGSDPVNGTDPTGNGTGTVTFDPNPGGGWTVTGGSSCGIVCYDGSGSHGNRLTYGSISLSQIMLMAAAEKAKKARRQNDEGEDIVVTAAKKVAQCAVDQFGLGELGEAAAVAAGQPIPGTKRFVTPGSSRGTSLAGMAADKVLGRTRLPVRLPTIVGGPGTGRALAIAGTKSAARFAGRAVPIVGWALLAYDAASIAVCAASDD